MICQIKNAVKPLEKQGIRIITVGIGNSVDIKKLEKIAAVKKDVIKPKNSDKPDKTADEIVARVLNGKVVVYVQPHMRYTRSTTETVECILIYAVQFCDVLVLKHLYAKGGHNAHHIRSSNDLKSADQLPLPANLTFFFTYTFFLDSKILPEVDLGFAISTNALDSAKTFMLMKDTIKYIVDTYGRVKLRYGIIVFGNTPSIALSFSERFDDVDSLKVYLDQIQQPRGSPDLKKALDLSATMFDNASPPRPDAKRYLVVIMDDRSVNTLEELRSSAMPLEKVPIKVISVLVPPRADEVELDNIVPNKLNVINKDTEDNPKSLGEKIIDKVIESK